MTSREVSSSRPETEQQETSYVRMDEWSVTHQTVQFWARGSDNSSVFQQQTQDAQVSHFRHGLYVVESILLFV